MYCFLQVTLDLLQFENIAVRRVKRSEEGLVHKLGVTEFPSCYLYYPGGNITRLKVWVCVFQMHDTVGFYLMIISPTFPVSLQLFYPVKVKNAHLVKDCGSSKVAWACTDFHDTHFLCMNIIKLL